MLGVYLRGADSNTFRDVLIYGGSSAAIAVLFDYTGTSYFPCANSFYDIDPYGAGAAANIQQWVNNGYPSTGTRPNYIYGLNEANGASPPNIPALVPSLPNRSYYVSVPNSVSAICSSCLYTPPTDGLYRVSYAIMTTIAGTSGSIQLFVGANNAGSVQSYSANNISANTVGSATSGDFVVFSSAGYAMDYQVNFNWVVGTPKYSLYISVERLQ